MSEQDLIDLQYELLTEACERHVRSYSLASDSWVDRATRYAVAAHDELTEFDRNIMVAALNEFCEMNPETDYWHLYS